MALETDILANEWTSWWIENDEGKIALIGIFDSLQEAKESWQKLRSFCFFAQTKNHRSG